MRSVRPSKGGDREMSNDELPWHTLGLRLTNSSTAEQAVRAAGLDWRIAKTQTYVGPEHRVLPGRHAVVREDLWNEGKVGFLGSAVADYTPMQNIEAFNFFDPIVRTGAAFYDSMGALLQGQWVWIMLRFHGDVEIAPNDLIGKFLLFGNSPANGYHRLVYVPVRLTCQNSLCGGYFHNPSPQISIPRVRPRKFQVSTEAAINELQHHFDELGTQFRAMVQIKLTEQHLKQYLRKVYDDWVNKGTLFVKRAQTEGWPRSLAECEHDLTECIRLFEEGKGNDLPGVAGTLWAACSAVAEYVDFHKLNADDPKYLNEIWFSELKGSGLKIANKIILGS
jgi:phage/plasmid-like protein (TIGR03299 family)